MNLSDFDFFLPEELIALRPAKPRTSSRLLVSKDGSLTDTNFYNLENFLKAGDRIVFNDTRVLKSLISAVRLRRDGLTFSKANIKFNLLEKISNSKWKILAKPLRKLRTNDILKLANDEQQLFLMHINQLLKPIMADTTSEQIMSKNLSDIRNTENKLSTLQRLVKKIKN